MSIATKGPKGNAARGCAYLVLLAIGVGTAFVSLVAISGAWGRVSDRISNAVNSASVASTPSATTTALAAVDEDVPASVVIDDEARASQAAILITTQGPRGPLVGSGFVLEHAKSFTIVATQFANLAPGGSLGNSFAVQPQPNAPSLSAYPLDDSAELRPPGFALLLVGEEGASGFNPPPSRGNATAAGRAVFCAGNPLGQTFFATAGHVRSQGVGTFSPDCVVERGSVGGPVLDSKGQLIGMLTGIAPTQADDLTTVLEDERVDAISIASNVNAWQPGPLIQKGKKVTVAATGQWKMGLFAGSSGPGGVVGNQRYRFDQRFSFGALICRQGKETFAVDARWPSTGLGDETHLTRVREFVATESEPLECRANDNDVTNNEGAINLVVWSR